MTKTFKEAVQQTEFNNSQIEAALNIIFTAGRLDDIIRCELKPFDITPEQYNVLHILSGKHPEGYALKEIQSRMLKRWSNTFRLVEKLRKKGYLSRQPLPENRRKVEIKITEEGVDFVEMVDEEQITGGYLSNHFPQRKRKFYQNRWMSFVQIWRKIEKRCNVLQSISSYK